MRYRSCPCENHSHPFVRLKLKSPDTDEGELFAKLLDSERVQPGPMRTTHMGEGLPESMIHRQLGGKSTFDCVEQYEFCKFMNKIRRMWGLPEVDCIWPYLDCLEKSWREPGGIVQGTP